MNNQKVYRSHDDQVLSGVLGGVSEYFGWNSQIVRLIFAIFVAMTGFFPGVFIYLIAMLIIPKAPYYK
ncbi:PspC domain-containing protein [Weissella kandleri]|uniref:PspC domain-containing protein n=1 Tax=Weissella kandleri TaxID=1616 RepID=UPI00387EB26B